MNKKNTNLFYYFRFLLLISLTFQITNSLALDQVLNLKEAIVHITATTYPRGVDGNDKRKHGTGFYINKIGYILTAAHTVLPTSIISLERKKPTITIKTWRNGKVSKEDAFLVYADFQTDLAILRGISPSPSFLELGNSISIKEEDSIEILAFGLGRKKPQALLNGYILDDFSSSLGGLISLNISGLEKSDSGSPILNRESQVIGVLSKGFDDLTKGNINIILAAPINYASPLLSMAGIMHPSTIRQWIRNEPDLDKNVDEAQGIIKELKTELTWNAQFVDDRNRLEIKYTRSLSLGLNPDKVYVHYYPHIIVKLKSNIFGAGGVEKEIPLPLKKALEKEFTPPKTTEKENVLDDAEIYSRIEKLVEDYKTNGNKEFVRLGKLKLNITADLIGKTIFQEANISTEL